MLFQTANSSLTLIRSSDSEIIIFKFLSKELLPDRHLEGTRERRETERQTEGGRETEN